MSDWQDISTAPKKGYIDLFDANRGWRAPDCYWHRTDEQWKSKHRAGDGFSVLRAPFTATHWMSLPKPPAILAN